MPELTDILNNLDIPENHQDTPTDETGSVENTSVEDEATTEDGQDKTVETTTTENPTEPQKKPTNADFAKKRIENKQLKQQVSQYEQTLARIAKQRGITVDELLEEQQQEADKREAEKRGVDPTIQRELRELRQKQEQAELEKQQTRFNYSILGLQQKFQLDHEGLVDFVNKATDAGYDLLGGNYDFELLYKSMNFDALMEQRIEQERQKWLADQERKRNSSPSTTVTNSKGTKQSQKMTMQDILANLKI